MQYEIATSGWWSRERAGCAAAYHGNELPRLLRRKVGGPYQRRDLAVWLQEDPRAPSDKARLPDLEAVWREMTEDAKHVFGPDPA